MLMVLLRWHINLAGFADHEVKHLETIVALMCDLGVDVPSTLWKYYRSDRAQNHCSLEITALQHKNEQKPDLRSSNSPTVDRDRGLDNGKPMKKPKKPRLKRVENGKHQREAKKSEDTSAVIAALEKLVAGKSNPRSLSLELAPSPVLERKSTFVEIQVG